MKLSNTEYQEYVQRLAQPSPLGKNMALAFLIGGAICTLGQLVQNGWMAAGAGKLEAGTLTSVTMIFLSVLLTGLNLYNKLARFGGAGTLVPITGFANAVASPAIDFKSEGLITGMGAKMFIVAGPVIVYGVAASALYGVILCAFELPQTVQITVCICAHSRFRVWQGKQGFRSVSRAQAAHRKALLCFQHDPFDPVFRYHGVGSKAHAHMGCSGTDSEHGDVELRRAAGVGGQDGKAAAAAG